VRRTTAGSGGTAPTSRLHRSRLLSPSYAWMLIITDWIINTMEWELCNRERRTA
jgi:hypothetical protein